MKTLCRTIYLINTVLVTLVFSQFSSAATITTIDLNVQKFIGGVSELDRKKYFNIHSTPLANQVTKSELDYLVNVLNVGFGRNFGSPFTRLVDKAPYPSETSAKESGAANISFIKSHPNYTFYNTRAVSTDHPRNIFVAGENPVQTAIWARNYFKHYYDNATRPQFYEPMNEPFVHSGEFGIDAETARLQMIKVFAEIGKQFDQQNIKTKVIGYASAWPSMELWDFDHFNGRMKKFMDIAGPHIDSFSVHPYDGVNVTGANNQRSGSNMESILDLVETYSHYKWDLVKPHSITEYGGIEKGYPAEYSDVKSVQSVRSINNMLFELLDRQDRLLISVPFITHKSAWFYNAGNNWTPYGADMLRPDPKSIVNGKPTKFFLTAKVHFYQLWQAVEGTRLKATSSNEDIQIQAFTKGKNAYIALNSIAEKNEMVTLDILNNSGSIKNVRKRSLKVYPNSKPVYQNQNAIAVPSSLTLVPGETVILEYTFANNIAPKETLNVTNYYSDDHLKTISTNKELSFRFNNVTVNKGASVLKMSIGRAHNLSKTPLIKVNGTTVSVPKNWTGGDQSSRKEFFGAIHIPVSNDLLKQNNLITLKFPDAGGRVSSVVLEMHSDSSSPNSTTNSISFAKPFTSLPPQDSYAIKLDYSASTNRDIVLEMWKGSKYLTHATAMVTAGKGEKTLTVTPASKPKNGETDYVFKTSIRPVGGNWQTALDAKRSPNIAIEDTIAPSIDSFEFASVTTTLPSEASYTFSVNYSASIERDIIVELWSSSAWLSSGKVSVPPGTGTIQVTVNLSTPPPAGPGYVLKGAIRPVNSQWQSNIEASRQADITVTGTGITPPTDWTNIELRHSEKCIDVSDGKTSNFSTYQQYSCSDTNINQQFLFENRANNHWGIKSRVSGKCVDLAAGSKANNAKIQQYTCNTSNPNQSWKIIETGSGWFELRSQVSGKCLNIANSSVANSALLTQNQCSNGLNQQFRFK